MKRVAIVTGSNKGVGLATVKTLATKFDGDVILTSRDVARGEAAVASIGNCKNVRFHQLDIDDAASVARLRDFVKTEYGGIDVLVNNAGIAYAQDAVESFAVQAKVTVGTNYFATKALCNILFPLLRPGARVVNVSSLASTMTLSKASESIKKKLANPQMTAEELDVLMHEFVDAAQEGDDLKGWPKSAYGTSKVGLSALSIIQQREFDRKEPKADKVVNHVHPGYVDTDMSKHKGPRTVEEGCRSSVYAALLPPGTDVRGKYIWEDCSIREWAG